MLIYLGLSSFNAKTPLEVLKMGWNYLVCYAIRLVCYFEIVSCFPSSPLIPDSWQQCLCQKVISSFVFSYFQQH